MSETKKLEEIITIIEENKDKTSKGFVVKGKFLEEDKSKSCTDFEYVNGLLKKIHASRDRHFIQGTYSKITDKEGITHEINIKAISNVTKEVKHDITINYFVIDTEKEEREKKALEELYMQGEAIPNIYAKHGFIDKRPFDRHENIALFGAMFAFMTPWKLKDRVDFMIYASKRFVDAYEGIFGKKE